jgi:hypothetical protein
MNHRDLNLNDRERRLRLAIERLKRRTPKGQKPPDAVVPAWDGQGGMICPKSRSAEGGALPLSPGTLGTRWKRGWFSCRARSTSAHTGAGRPTS